MQAVKSQAKKSLEQTGWIKGSTEAIRKVICHHFLSNSRFHFDGGVRESEMKCVLQISVNDRLLLGMFTSP